MLVAPHILAGYCARTYGSETPTWIYKDVAAFLFHHPLEWCRVPVIAFRGTLPDDVENWARDLDVWPRWDPRLWLCCAGFLDGADGLLAAIEASLKSRVLWLNPVLTGHSLGGALAVDVAALMAVLGYGIAQLTVFNAPRAGGRRVRKIIRNIPSAQYRQRGDVVSEVPRAFRLYVPSTPIVSIGHEMMPVEAHRISNFTQIGDYLNA